MSEDRDDVLAPPEGRADAIGADQAGSVSAPVAKKSILKKIFIGCGAGCLVMILTIAGVGYYAYHVYQERLEQDIASCEALGYKLVANPDRWETQVVNEPVAEKSLFVGNVIDLNKGATADIALLANMAKLTGNYQGVYFKGKVLVISKDSTVAQVDGFVNMLVVLGKVEKITARVNQTTNRMPSQAEIEKIMMDLSDFSEAFPDAVQESGVKKDTPVRDGQ